MRLPAEQRRHQLLEVACDIFAERGFHGTAMDEVALAAGVTKPVLYQHFPSKRALYRELLEDVVERLTTALREAAGRASNGRERVHMGFSAYFRFVDANPSAFRLLFGASVRNDAEFAAIAEHAIDEIAELIAGLIEIDAAPQHRRALGHALVGMAEATSRRFGQADAVADPEHLAQWLAELAWFGLRGVRADEPVAGHQG